MMQKEEIPRQGFENPLEVDRKKKKTKRHVKCLPFISLSQIPVEIFSSLDHAIAISTVTLKHQDRVIIGARVLPDS